MDRTEAGELTGHSASMDPLGYLLWLMFKARIETQGLVSKWRSPKPHDFPSIKRGARVNPLFVLRFDWNIDINIIYKFCVNTMIHMILM